MSLGRTKPSSPGDTTVNASNINNPQKLNTGVDLSRYTGFEDLTSSDTISFFLCLSFSLGGFGDWKAQTSGMTVELITTQRLGCVLHLERVVNILYIFLPVLTLSI